MEQLILSFPLKEMLDKENFSVSKSNEDAVLWLDKAEKWSFKTLLLVGPEGSGKTHLSEVFKATTPNAVLFEDLDRKIARNGKDVEEELFHIFNKVQEKNQRLLITSRLPLSTLRITLKDLESRLKAAQTTYLKSPDDTLLTKVLEKLFKDRQLELSPESLSYLSTRITRDFDTLKSIAETVDQEQLRTKRKVTIPFLRDILTAKGYIEHEHKNEDE